LLSVIDYQSARHMVISLFGQLIIGSLVTGVFFSHSSCHMVNIGG